MGASSWSGFRRGLGILREAVDPKKLEILRNAHIDEWLPLSTSTVAVREYLQNYVWTKRTKWATCYFQDAFNCGAMRTQRSESWHAVLKQFSNLKSLIDLFGAIQKLLLGYHISEMPRAREEHGIQSFSNSLVLSSEPFHTLLIRERYSSYASAEMPKRMDSALQLRVH